MTLDTIAAFSLTFLLLALAPGAGLAMVLSRTLASGMAAGFAVTTGLILGDFVFMGLAMVGLSALATAAGPLFVVVKYIAAAYLIWLGVRSFMDAAKPVELLAQQNQVPRALWREVGMGLLVTLGNPKPLLFYGALLPTFLDMRTVGLADYGVLCAIVVGISYAVYGGYMLLVARARRLMMSSRAVKRLNQATGTMFIGSGVLVATR
jgi:threonine/homoserine/homoserine lactone efflux protein